ncbi:hypothetical protein [Nocardia asiatica]|uniref:helix-turn-helix domain-containing protein n=1 Tax=Nocardia asiatica TaxID=209252 RepID=UPI003EDEB5C1
MAARRRASSEDARLAQLYRRAEWSSRALIAVVVLGMVWAGVNVQHNLVPSGDMSDPLYWLSYGIEAMISIPIITIMVAATTAARWGRELARGKVIFFEAALLGTTVALNTGPHLAAGDLGRAVEYAIAPVMVGVVIWLHAWVSARYAVLIDGAPVVDRDPQPIRIDAQRPPGMPDGGGHYFLADSGTADGGRFPEEQGSAARVNNGRAAEYDAGSGGRFGLSTADVQHAGVDTSAHRFTPPGTTADRREIRRDEVAGAISAAPSHADYRNPSATNGHAVGSPTNGHVVTASVDGHDVDRSEMAPVETSVNGNTHDFSVNGHTVLPVDGQISETPVNGNANRPRSNGHTVQPLPNSCTSEIPTDSTAHSTPVDGRPAHSTGNGQAVKTPSNGDAYPLPANGHTVRPTTNGHPFEIPTNGNTHSPHINGHTVHPATNGHSVETSANGNTHSPQVNGHTIHPTTNGHPVETRANGNTHSLQVNGYTDRPAANEHPDQTATSGNAHSPHINGHTIHPTTNDHPVETRANSNAHPFPINGHTLHPTADRHPVESSPTADADASQVDGDSSLNGRVAAHTAGNGQHGHPPVPATNGHTADVATGVDAHALPVDRSITAPVEHTGTLAADGASNPSVIGGGQEEPPSTKDPIGSVAAQDSHVAAPLTSPAESAQPSPSAAEHAALNRVEVPVPTGQELRLDLARPSAPRQISLADLHDGFEFDDANNAAAQPNPDRSRHPSDRTRHGNDGARHPGSPAPEPMPAATDAAAQVHPNATAPRAAKRGKSLSAEQSDRSADAESEQLALEETPEPVYPRVEPRPIIDADDEDDDQFPTEPEEADTDDDEISALARAITDRRLSNLPIEEVREILTLADQGGSTPAIANELGVSRSAVTRVLDAAIKVHRPYATIG